MELPARVAAAGADRIFSKMSAVIGVIQGIALGGIIVCILMSIILRNFFDFGLVWVFEASGFLMVSLVFLGVPKNLYQKEDIAVDFVTARLSRGLQKVAWYFRKGVILSVAFIFVYFLYHHNLRFGQLRSPTLEIPHWVFYASVLIGPALAILVAVWHLSLGLRRKADYDRT